LKGVPNDASDLPPADGPANEQARARIMACIQASCGASLAEALPIQAKHAAEFLASRACKAGAVGADYMKTMAV
jgi:hypothetical protein